MEKEENISKALEKIYELTEENNKLIKKLEKYQKINTTIKVIYWTIILLSVFGAYFAIQPFLGSLLGKENTTLDTISNQTQNFPEISKIKNILNGIGN